MNRRTWLKSLGKLLIAIGAPALLTGGLPEAAGALTPAQRLRRRMRRRLHRMRRRRRRGPRKL